MAIIHQAQISPTKLEMLAGWVPSRPWFAGRSGAEPERVGAYRFDDPAGDVGVEIMLVSFGGPVLQVPLTYRAEPLAGAEEHLIGTMNHSVLGERWVYDGCGDPVFASTLATAILTGGRQADEILQTENGEQLRPPLATVRGTGTGTGTGGAQVPTIDSVTPSDDGSVTTIDAGGGRLQIFRVLDGSAAAGSDPALLGQWDDETDQVLAALR